MYFRNVVRRILKLQMCVSGNSQITEPFLRLKIRKGPVGELRHAVSFGTLCNLKDDSVANLFSVILRMTLLPMSRKIRMYCSIMNQDSPTLMNYAHASVIYNTYVISGRLQFRTFASLTEKTPRKKIRDRKCLCIHRLWHRFRKLDNKVVIDPLIFLLN